VEDEKALLIGRKFETELFGEMPVRSQVRPGYLSLERSIQQQVKSNWKRFGRAIASGRVDHNPYEPATGKLDLVWKAVKRAIERKWPKDDYWPVLLYTAIGTNSLDWHHGVDAFVWWNGVFVTIDASTYYKGEKKADFILTAAELRKPNLSYFGQRVANLLIRRTQE